jgi:hypothetical protein
MNGQRTKRKLSVIFSRINRNIARSVFIIPRKRTFTERLILKIVRNIINDPNGKVHYSIKTKKMYLVPGNESDVISFDKSSIIIGNKKIEIDLILYDVIFGECTECIEKNLTVLDTLINEKEKLFLYNKLNEIKRINT